MSRKQRREPKRRVKIGLRGGGNLCVAICSSRSFVPDDDGSGGHGCARVTMLQAWGSVVLDNFSGEIAGQAGGKGQPASPLDRGDNHISRLLSSFLNFLQSVNRSCAV